MRLTQFDTSLPKTSRIATKGILRALPKPQGTQAACALYGVAIAQGSVLFAQRQSPAHLEVPSDYLVGLSNLSADGTNSPLPIGMLRVTGEIFYFFSDRSGFVAREIMRGGQEILQIYPVILFLAADVSLKYSSYKLKITSPRDTAPQLSLSLVKPNQNLDEIPLTSQSVSDEYDENLRQAVCAQLVLEIKAWVNRIDTAPCVSPLKEGLASGIYGVDAPAPDPAVMNLPFARPAFLPYRNRSTAELKAAATFLRLAWVHFREIHGEKIRAASIHVHADRLGRRRTPIIQIAFKVVPAADPTRYLDRRELRDLETWFRTLLSVPDAPPGLQTIISQQAFVPDKGNLNIEVKEELLFAASTHEAISNHDRRRATRLFERDTAPVAT